MSGKEDRPVGKTKDAGWQVGARRTYDLPLDRVWEFLTSERGLRLWLGKSPGIELRAGNAYRLPDGTGGEVRVFKPRSHIRLTWRPPGWERHSTVQLRVIPKGERCVVAFHQEHLPDGAARETRRAYYLKVLEQLEDELETENADRE